MKYLRLLNGWIRLNVWGVCPHCNHDAPLLYECPVCDYYDRLPRYKSKQTKHEKNNIWKIFKDLILNE